MTRRLLLLLRHAKAVASAGPASEASDQARDLTDRGRQDASRLSKALRSQGLQPDLALVSSALRTRRTWDLLAPFAEPAPTLVISDRIYLAEADDLLFLLRETAEEIGSVMLVGHNPGLHELALHLARAGGDTSGLDDGMPTCALAKFEVNGPWSDLRPHNTERFQMIRS
ncbi:MAG: SixA phosphatase family protein [Janthinobacterium lividum]